MDYAIRIISQKSEEAVLTINAEFAEKLKLIKKKRGYLSFGTHRNYVNLDFSKELAENEIALSSQVVEALHIPDFLDFEVRVKGNEILLGPCIGILASKKDEDITKGRLKEIAMNTLSYSRIHGAIIVFALDKVDRINRLIEGLCYNPVKDAWERGVFPYPLSIYRRANMNEKWMNHFLSAIGDTVFSNYSFDKWDMHQWFSNEPAILPNLPETRTYRNKEDMLAMLEKHRVVYTKPIWGMKGFGVVRVSLEEDKYCFQYREEGENRTIITENSEEFEHTLETLFEPESHIIQQGLHLIRYDGGIVDFRCVMQKNETGQWVCNGIIARVGAKESVVSNISSGGAALPGIDLMREGLPVSEEELFVLREKMVSLCTKVCRTLDEYGFNFGTLGLDVGIDIDYNIWLIEVNNRKPHPGIAIRANDIPAYYTILTSPLGYAKWLSGFGSREEFADGI